jgi:hypothetical protein
LSGDVVLETWIPSAITATTTATQQAYLAAIYALAVTNGLDVIDHFAAWGSYEISNPYGYYSDNTPGHPTKIGYDDVGNREARFIANL